MKSHVLSIKIAVVSVFGICAIAITLITGGNTSKVHAFPEGAGGGFTGAPSETDCRSCHSQNSGSGQFTLDLPANYVPGQTYSINVNLSTSDTSRRRWGFEMTALNSSNSRAGTFSDTTSATNSFIDSGRNYVDQSSSGTFRNQTSGASWTFDWTAPSTDVGAVTFYASGLQCDNDGGEDGDQTYLASTTIQPAPAIVPNHDFVDFDGDGKADPAVFRPGSGDWHVSLSTGSTLATHLGAAGDVPVPLDFDGDDKTDFAVWRAGPPAEAAFYVLESTTNTVRVQTLGQTGDVPAPSGDWDGDGKADFAVYRDSAVGSQSFFYFIGSLNNPGNGTTYLPWGTTGDMPVRGDFDGDGMMDLAVFRPSNAVWYILQSSNSALRAEKWGLSSDSLVSGDFDGDAKTDLTVFRNGVWYVRRSTDSGVSYLNWGVNSDSLVPADYDGDGTTDAAVFRNGVWWINESLSGTTRVEGFGLASDSAVAGFNAQ